MYIIWSSYLFTPHHTQRPRRLHKIVCPNFNRRVQSDKVRIDVRSGKHVTFSYNHIATEQI
jgi:hypothetical protein